MTIDELKQKIISESKTLNSRIRRLRKESLPSSVDARLQQAKDFKSPLVTASGFVSASTKGLTLKQLREKLKWIRGVKENTETVQQARLLVEQKAKEWNVKKKEAARRIQQGRLFYQVIGYQGYKWDSTEVQDAITSFDHTPTFDELVNRLYEKFGHTMQDTQEGQDLLKAWMNEHNEIPWGVYAHREINPITGQEEIIFDDETFDENGNIVYVSDSDIV